MKHNGKNRRCGLFLRPRATVICGRTVVRNQPVPKADSPHSAARARSGMTRSSVSSRPRSVAEHAMAARKLTPMSSARRAERPTERRSRNRRRSRALFRPSCRIDCVAPRQPARSWGRQVVHKNATGHPQRKSELGPRTLTMFAVSSSLAGSSRLRGKRGRCLSSAGAAAQTRSALLRASAVGGRRAIVSERGARGAQRIWAASMMSGAHGGEARCLARKTLAQRPKVRREARPRPRHPQCSAQESAIQHGIRPVTFRID